MKMQLNRGFTLVEIAIVLVIVGLLIGGVLKGQEMITNAKLKRIESDNAGFAAAMFSYQDRYLQLPGDDGAATGRFDFYTNEVADGGMAWTTEANGNGDGVIGIGTDWDTLDTGNVMIGTSVEPGKFFGHLRAAGLIPGGSGSSTTRPTNAYGGLVGIQNGSLSMSGHSMIFAQIEGPIARILESRLDDGSGAAGRIRGNKSSENDMDAGTTGETTYEEAERYDLAFRL